MDRHADARNAGADDQHILINGGGIRLHAAVAGGRACHHIVSQLYPGFRLRITLHFAIELTLTETAAAHPRHRPEERRVGKECVSTCSTRCAPYHIKKKNK